MSRLESKKSIGADPFMDVEEHPAMMKGDMRGLAFLEEGARPVGEAPAWLDQLLAGRLAVAICRPARGGLPGGSWLAAEEVAPGRFALACEADGLERLVAAVRAACADGGLGVVAVGPGGLGHSVLLGPVPERAAALFTEREAARRPGVYVDEATLATLRVPALPMGTTFLLPSAPRRRTWLAPVLAMAAAAVLGFGLFRLMAPGTPQGRIYLFGQHTSQERGPAADQVWRAGDLVVVTLEGEPGTFATLLLLDSTDRFVMADPQALNVPLTGQSQQLEIKKVFDDQPGRERFVGLISRAPLSELAPLVDRLNATSGDRAARLDALAAALEDRATVVPAAELEHR